jgi:hypothetical protein
MKNPILIGVGCTWLYMHGPCEDGSPKSVIKKVSFTAVNEEGEGWWMVSRGIQVTSKAERPDRPRRHPFPRPQLSPWQTHDHVAVNLTQGRGDPAARKRGLENARSGKDDLQCRTQHPRFSPNSPNSPNSLYPSLWTRLMYEPHFVRYILHFTNFAKFF